MRRRATGGSLPAARRARVTVAIASIALAAGCAYSFRGVLPGHIRTIAIPVFGNNTVEHGLADDVTQAIADGFLNDRRLRIVREGDADAVLKGTILSYRNQVYGYTREERAEQYEVVMIVQVSLRDQVKNRQLWKQDSWTVRTVYTLGAPANVSDPASAPPRSESEARAAVIGKLTEQIVSRTVQGW